MTGVRTCYMGTYASIGILDSRYDWIIGSLAAIRLTTGPGDLNSYHNGYLWTTANITKSYHVPAILDTAGGVKTCGEPDKNLMCVIRQLKSNAIGVDGVEITLKRDNEFSISGRRRNAHLH